MIENRTKGLRGFFFYSRIIFVTIIYTLLPYHTFSFQLSNLINTHTRTHVRDTPVRPGPVSSVRHSSPRCPTTSWRNKRKIGYSIGAQHLRTNTPRPTRRCRTPCPAYACDRFYGKKFLLSCLFFCEQFKILSNTAVKAEAVRTEGSRLKTCINMCTRTRSPCE